MSVSTASIRWYAEITARIIDQMENGIIPWQKPWVTNGKAISHATGKAYSLLNQMLLGRPGEYLTFKQCQEAGGRVRKGEKSSMVVFWKWIEQEDEETGEKKEVPFLRYYNVFHIDQCEGISAKHTTETVLPDGADTMETAQDIIYDYLSRTGEPLKVVCHIRDEAHRFGITFHRQKRSLAFINSELEQIPGIGTKSLNALLRHFKTVSKVREATLSELSEVVGESRAKKIIEYFNPKQE